ncbi:hypothetical protein LCGC14_2580610, partial [marine sediment metagenome]
LCDALMYGCNIVARAAPPPQVDSRLDKLSAQDRLLWSKILRHDSRSALARR